MLYGGCMHSRILYSMTRKENVIYSIYPAFSPSVRRVVRMQFLKITSGMSGKKVESTTWTWGGHLFVGHLKFLSFIQRISLKKSNSAPWEKIRDITINDNINIWVMRDSSYFLVNVFDWIMQVVIDKWTQQHK